MPRAIKLPIVVGMGLLIAMIGLVSIDFIVANPKTLVEMGDVWGDPNLQLSCAGMLLMASLLFHDVKGAILIGILALTLAEWYMNSDWPSTFFQLPVVHDNGYFNPGVIADLDQASVLLPALLSFVLICIFDISGVLFGLATLGGLLGPDGESVPGSLWAFVASGCGTLVAAWLGSTPVIVCVESASGVREGGRAHGPDGGGRLDVLRAERVPGPVLRERPGDRHPRPSWSWSAR